MKATAVAAAFIWLIHLTVQAAEERQILRDSVSPVVSQLQPIGSPASTKSLELTIALPLRNPEALRSYISWIYTPGSSDYQKYLSPDQFAQQFGPTEKDYDTLIAFVKSNGLELIETHPNRTLLDVRGSVSTIEKLFNVSMRTYQHPRESRTFFAPSAPPSLKAPVTILSVSGLDDFMLPRPMNLITTMDQSRESIAYASGSGPRGDFAGEDFRAAYAPGVSLDGAGQTVGIFALDGYFLSDIRAYENLFGLPEVPLTNVLVGTATGFPGVNNVEVALDIEMVISMAPGLSKVIVYHGRANAPNTALNRMATDNLAKQLSCSWGFGAQEDPAREQIFLQYAAQGQSFFQASGDFGAWPDQIIPPSNDPWVTVVGGTVLTTSTPGGAWASETVWSPSGGGFATNFAIPVWQQGIATTANQASTTFRNIPDVAAIADVLLLVIVNNGQHTKVGGTSASAPLWAGFAALANQQAAALGKPPLGFLNPALYAVGKGPAYSAAFHDITVGNNTNSASSNRFFATPGYDLCTGWGTPTGSSLINALLAPPDALKISPASNSSASGPVGGPFAPTVQNYALTNIGPGSVGWALVNTSAWFNATPLSGTVAAGGSSNFVSLSLKPAATNLTAGSYTDTLLFNNLNNGVIQTRQFTLAVVTPPAISSQPNNQTVFEGMPASFSVTAGTNALLTYQWRYDNGAVLTNLSDGPNIQGSSSNNLVIKNASASNAGAYSVIVSNAAGSILSSNAFLAIVPWRPVILSQPTSQTALPEQTVKLAVSAVGTQPLTYRWRRNGTNLTDTAYISGATTPVLTLSQISSTNAGTYSVLVSNALGTASSDDALLTVTPLAIPGVAMTTLYSFTGGADGANPNGLIQGTNGKLFSTTRNGGTHGGGTVFELSTNGALSTHYSFTGAPDGARPLSPLLEADDGSLYGSTYQGGTNDYGSVFRITPGGPLSTVRSLDYPDGILPYSPLIKASDGNFYGSGYEGGNGTFGTIYKLTSSGLFNPLCTFTGGIDGGFVYSEVTQGVDGGLYGTAYRNGATGGGTVFKVTTNGVFTILHSFVRTNGAFPATGLTPGSDGQFYGTTTGGSSPVTNGTLFRITESGIHTRLYSFTGGADGAVPSASLLHASDGNFYGTTAYGGAYGGGTLFRLAPNGSFATLAQFAGLNGANPLAPLMQASDGGIYGTTQNGGTNGSGAIFRMTVVDATPQITSQPASQTVFEGANVLLNTAVFGSQPLSFQWRENGTNLVEAGNISGTTTRALRLSAVTMNDAGTYSLVITNPFGSVTSSPAILQVTSSPPVIVQQPTNQTLAPGGTVTLAAAALGNFPLTYRWQKNGTNLVDAGNLIGATQDTLLITNAVEPNNGMYRLIVSNNLGMATSSVAVVTVVPVSVAGTKLTTLYSFSGGSNGDTPNGLMVGTNGLLYGTTRFGGSNNAGIVFSMPPDGTPTPLASFRGTNGSNPYAGLFQSRDGNFYGTAKNGGDFTQGVVFKMTSVNLLTSLYSFTGYEDGGNPPATLIQATDNILYGVSSGGTNGYGVAFGLSTNGVLNTAYAFTNGSDGSYPESALMQANDGNLYGLSQGGALGAGNVYRMNAAGDVANLYTFKNGTDGSAPQGPLVQGSDGYLYGATMRNTIQGFQFYGTFFKITTNGAFTTLYALNYGEGAYPHAGLVEASDGNFYGTAFAGGAPGNGTVVRITPNGSFTSLLNLDGFDTGARPEAPLVEGPDGNLYGTTTTGGPGGRGTVFRLSMTAAPQILTQPASQTILAGSPCTLSVTVFGAAPLFWQWQRSGTNLADGGNISGTSARVLQFANVTPNNAGNYSIIVSNSLGSITSAPAMLTVIAPPIFQSINRSNNVVALMWSTLAGQKYQLQFRTNLSSGNWSNLGNSITATGSTAAATDPAASNLQRFYRVALLP